MVLKSFTSIAHIHPEFIDSISISISVIDLYRVVFSVNVGNSISVIYLENVYNEEVGVNLLIGGGKEEASMERPLDNSIGVKVLRRKRQEAFEHQCGSIHCVDCIRQDGATSLLVMLAFCDVLAFGDV